MNNYRPISVVPIIAKVFERIVYDQLYAYLTEHDIVCKHQSGFRTLHSTVTALLEATDTWAYNIDKGSLLIARATSELRHRCSCRVLASQPQ